MIPDAAEEVESRRKEKTETAQGVRATPRWRTECVIRQPALP